MKSLLPPLAASAVLLVTNVAVPGSAAAQETTPQSCTYDACALRIEHGAFFSGTELLRGARGARVGPIGPYNTTLSQAVAGSDSAMVYAATFQEKYRWGSSMALAGSIIGAVPILLSGDDFSDVDIAFTITGWGIALVGGWMVTSGWRDLSRSIWWYNRQFVEAGGTP